MPTEHNSTVTHRGLVPTDIRYFRVPEEITISPNGKYVAYTVRRIDANNDGYMVEAHLIELNGSHEPKRLTSTSANGTVTSLTWSSDSTRLAFVHQTAGEASLWIKELGGAETTYKIDGATPSKLTWSPDGRYITAVRWTEVVRGVEPVYGDPWPTPPSMKVITKNVYKLNGVGFVQNHYRHIWNFEVGTQQWIQLTDGEYDHDQPSWSRSGHQLAYLRVNREAGADLGDGDLLLWTPVTGEVAKPLKDVGAKAQCVCWSPDDKSIVFVGHCSAKRTTRRTYSTVYHYNLGTKGLVDLVPDSTDVIGNYAVSDQRKALTNFTVRWPQDSNEVYFLITEKGAVNLYAVDTSTKERRKIAGDKSVVFEYAPTNKRVVYGEAHTSSPGDLWLQDGDERHRLTHLNPWLEYRQLSTPEEYWYNGLDNEKVHAWIIRPTRFDITKRYPLILQVHCSMFSYDFNFEFQIMAQAGYAVAYFNQRGTTAGYGEAWTQATVGNEDDVDFQEVMLGVDDLIKRHPFIDADRMGVTGGSCGGILTNWIVGHTGRFRAAVTQRSITNHVSEFGAADIGPAVVIGETDTTPWDNLEKVWNKSSIAYAKNITTPLLIIHSDQDFRCPIEQAEELFVVLRWMGKDVEFCWFEGESHGLSRNGHPSNRVERLRRIVGWFEKHLKN